MSKYDVTNRGSGPVQIGDGNSMYVGMPRGWTLPPETDIETARARLGEVHAELASLPQRAEVAMPAEAASRATAELKKPESQRDWKSIREWVDVLVKGVGVLPGLITSATLVKTLLGF